MLYRDDYPSIAHALSDLQENPATSEGYARSALFRVARLDWHAYEPEDFVQLLNELKEAAERRATWITKSAPHVEVSVKLGGEGTVGGLNGTVNLWLTAVGYPEALA